MSFWQQTAEERTAILRRLLRLFTQEFEGVRPDAVLILILSPVFLIFHSYYGKTRFFRRTILPILLDRFPALEMSDHLSAFPYYYWFSSVSITLFLLPFISSRIVPRLRRCTTGFRPRSVGPGLGITFGLFLIMLPILFVTSRMPSFQSKYPLCAAARDGGEILVIYETLYFVYMFSWEYFFRSYMLFGLERGLGPGYSILIQTIPFTLMHVGKPVSETFGAIFAGILLGILAIRTRTFLFGTLLHWLIAVSLDLMIIYLR